MRRILFVSFLGLFFLILFKGNHTIKRTIQIIGASLKTEKVLPSISKAGDIKQSEDLLFIEDYDVNFHFEQEYTFLSLGLLASLSAFYNLLDNDEETEGLPNRIHLNLTANPKYITHRVLRI
ncbi:hypothetical protein Pedsa_0141 [Pseudopedobacter saltans DSM 12145]|uniref:Uncharacterized protein n=1 Tax=Pseudopedobacter saltans (strain ATCC 51119 / DSM 12145 / JCM 21818 / CCUG 39354 / LMG 10337 / NBRC 100064 / NCIMB 13643) TaxID=762903 RepID=F0SDK0_PSESL|nr:hypothetical protein [Pseudopedobacter saltans]ADY50727.1 hypothetical protein Pedsa_0141 [Pseudopedobacter saltans DSM 12145]